MALPDVTSRILRPGLECQEIGCSDAEIAHLHYEIQVKGQPVNPHTYTCGKADSEGGKAPLRALRADLAGHPVVPRDLLQDLLVLRTGRNANRAARMEAAARR